MTHYVSSNYADIFITNDNTIIKQMCVNAEHKREVRLLRKVHGIQFPKYISHKISEKKVKFKHGVFNDSEWVYRDYALIVEMEYCGIPLYNHISIHGLSSKLMFMILFSLYSFYKQTGYYHNDAKMKNFTIKKIPKKTLHFHSSKHTFTLHSVSYVPCLVDYGWATHTPTDDDIDTIVSDLLTIYPNSKILRNINKNKHPNIYCTIMRNFSSYVVK